MHAFGIAWDVDPDHNQLKMGRDEATLDGAEYDDFWNIVYDEGAIGLGKETTTGCTSSLPGLDNRNRPSRT